MDGLARHGDGPESQPRRSEGFSSRCLRWNVGLLDDCCMGQVTVEVWKHCTPTTGLVPKQLGGKKLGIDGEEQEVVHAAKVSLKRSFYLIFRGEVDKAVPVVVC